MSNSDSTKARPGREPEHASYGEAALESEVGGLDPLAGGRTRQLYVASLRMGSLVGGRELRLERAEAMLTFAGRVILALPARDVEKTVTKGLKVGMRSPRSAPAFGTIKSRNDAILYWIGWFEQLDPRDFVGTRGLKPPAAVRRVRHHRGHRREGGHQDVRPAGGGGVGVGQTKVTELMKRNGEVERSGYLKVVGRRARPGDLDSWQATTWRPTTKGRFAVQDGCLVDGTTSLYRKTPLLSPDVNVFVRKPNAWRLHCLLRPDEEVTVAELVEATGVKETQSAPTSSSWPSRAWPFASTGRPGAERRNPPTRRPRLPTDWITRPSSESAHEREEHIPHVEGRAPHLPGRTSR